MAVAVVAATFAAARLQALTHRGAITVATLLGATRAWVARPYLVHGLGQGTIAGAGAAGVVTLALVGLGRILGPMFPTVPVLAPLPALRWIALAILAGAGLGLALAWLATRDLSSRPGVG